MKKYFVRLSRYLSILIVMIILLIAVTNIHKQISFQDIVGGLLENNRIRLFLIIAAIYALIYPILVFGKKERYINGSFAANRDGIIKAFEEQNYMLSKEAGSTLKFRKKSGFSRVMSFGQDMIEVDTSGNPIIIDGLRKELRRLDVSLDMNLLRKD